MARVVVIALIAALLAIPGISHPVEAAKPRCGGLKATIVGSDKSQTMFGTKRDDVIVARAGVDRIFAGGGDDVICAGPGNDIIDGGAGRDRIFGEAGNDELKGGRGKDLLDGGVGEDACYPAAGGDKVMRCEEADLLVTITAPVRVPDETRIEFGLKVRNIGSKRSGLMDLAIEQVETSVTCSFDHSGTQPLQTSLWPGGFEEATFSIDEGCSTQPGGSDWNVQVTATVSAANPEDDLTNNTASARVDITPKVIPVGG